MSELDRLQAAPELYRARAQTTAGLATTAAAAISAGIVFGSAQLPAVAELLAVLAIGALLVSVAASVAASQFTEEREVDNAALATELKRLTRSIRKRIRVSSVSGAIAMALFLGMVAVVLFGESSRPSVVEVYLDDVVVAHLTRTCPGINDGVVRARTGGHSLDDFSKPLRLAVSADECASDSGVSLRVDRSHVDLLLEVPG